MLGMLSAVAGLASGAMNLFGQKKANEQNVQQADVARDFNAEEAQKQRDFSASQAQYQRNYNWDAMVNTQDFNAAEAQKNRDYQTEMSNTQYQRAIGDLQSAGLNPMLAYSQGGAGTPSGSSASASAASSGAATGSSASGPAATVQSIFGPGVQSAAQAADIVASIRNKEATNDLISAQAEAARAGAMNSTASAYKLTTENERIGRRLDLELDNLQQQTSSMKQSQLTESQRYELVKAQTRLTEIQQDLAKHNISAVDANVQLTKVKTRLGQLEVPGAENEARWQSSPAGYGARVASGVGSIVGDVAGSAFGLKRMGRLFSGAGD